MAEEKKVESMEKNLSESVETPSASKSEEICSDINREESSDTADGIQEVSSETKATEKSEVDGSQLSKDEEKESDTSEEQSKVSGDGDGEDSEWLDILGNGHLKKKVLKAGKEGTRPNRSLSVTVRFKGRLTDGTEVENHESYNFLQGEGEVIQGMNINCPVIQSFVNKKLISAEGSVEYIQSM